MADERVVLKVEIDDDSDTPSTQDLFDKTQNQQPPVSNQGGGGDGGGEQGGGQLLPRIGPGRQAAMIARAVSVGTFVGNVATKVIGKLFDGLKATVRLTNEIFQKLNNTTRDLVGTIASANAVEELRLQRARRNLGIEFQEAIIRNLRARTDFTIALERFEARLFAFLEPFSTFLLRVGESLLLDLELIVKEIQKFLGFLAQPVLLKNLLRGLGLPTGIVDSLVALAKKIDAVLSLWMADRARGAGVESELDKFFDASSFVPGPGVI